MRKLMKSLMILAVLTMAGLTMNAQTSTPTNGGVSATGYIFATIVQPISISKVTDMNFGNLAIGVSNGTLILSPAALRTVTGDVTLLTSLPGTISAGDFTVTGLANATYSITLPADNTVTIANSTLLTMAVNTFTSTPSGTGSLTSGTQSLLVGATLIVNGNQASGTYSGTYSVTVNYN
jgi:hypothetical protein